MFNEVSAITILKEVDTTGHSPLQVLCDDGNIYIVKARKYLGIDTEIYSEFLCNFLCNIWKINTPECAIVTIDADLLKSNPNLSKRHKPQLYKDQFCFGSLFQEALEIELPDFDISKKNQKLYHNLTDYLKIGLFDLWTVNNDRKPTNLNMLKVINGNKFDIYAIDHAYTFDTLRYDQLNLNLELSFNESILSLEFLKELKGKITQNDFENEWDTYLNQSIQKSESEIDKIFTFLTSYFEKESNFIGDLKRFLFSKERNGTIFADFLSRLT